MQILKVTKFLLWATLKRIFFGTLVELLYLLGLEFVPPSSMEFVVSKIIANDTFSPLKKSRNGVFLSV